MHPGLQCITIDKPVNLFNLLIRFTFILNFFEILLFIFQEFWKHDPFAAVKEENGDIYARGTQVR